MKTVIVKAIFLSLSALPLSVRAREGTKWHVKGALSEVFGKTGSGGLRFQVSKQDTQDCFKVFEQQSIIWEKCLTPEGINSGIYRFNIFTLSKSKGVKALVFFHHMGVSKGVSEYRKLQSHILIWSEKGPWPNSYTQGPVAEVTSVKRNENPWHRKLKVKAFDYDRDGVFELSFRFRERSYIYKVKEKGLKAFEL